MVWQLFRPLRPVPLHERKLFHVTPGSESYLGQRVVIILECLEIDPPGGRIRPIRPDDGIQFFIDPKTREFRNFP